MTSDAPPTIVFFDGVCGFCDSVVRFCLRTVRDDTVKFAPLQGETAAATRKRLPLFPESLDTFILVDHDAEGRERLHLRSTAAVRLARHLRWPWRVLAFAWIVPRPLRDLAYKTFATYRYRIFGTVDACAIPSPEDAARFLP